MHKLPIPPDQVNEKYESIGKARPEPALSGGVDVEHVRYLVARQVRDRYGGASDMWLWRRLHDDSGFPPPILINKRRFWLLSALDAWERSRAGKPQTTEAA